MEQAVALAKLHREPWRRAFYDNAPAGVVFDRALRSWVIIDPKLSQAALTDQRLTVVDYRRATQELARTTRTPLDHSAMALSYVP